MHRNPVKISKKLYLLFARHKLILTAEEKRLRLFAKSPAWKLPESRTVWIRHTMHVFQASMLLDPQLAICSYRFLDVPESVCLDIVRTSCSTVTQFQLNRRLLDFNYVHQGRELCLAFEHFQENGGVGKDHILCDCAAEKLFHLILSEVESIRNNKREELRLLQRDLLKAMPRYLEALSIENDAGEIESTLTWDISNSKYHANRFVVTFFERDYGDEGHRDYLIHGQCPTEEREPSPGNRSPNNVEREDGNHTRVKEEDGEEVSNLPRKTFDICSPPSTNILELHSPRLVIESCLRQIRRRVLRILYGKKLSPILVNYSFTWL